MKKTTLLTALMLTACATQYQAAGQNYRPAGNEKQIQITGQLLQKYNAFSTEHQATIYFNGSPQITIPLDSKYFGEATGQPLNGKTTSADCTGKRTSKTNVEIRCMVFIDNEKTVTLTF